MAHTDIHLIRPIGDNRFVLRREIARRRQFIGMYYARAYIVRASTTNFHSVESFRMGSAADVCGGGGVWAAVTPSCHSPRPSADLIELLPVREIAVATPFH